MSKRASIVVLGLAVLLSGAAQAEGDSPRVRALKQKQRAAAQAAEEAEEQQILKSTGGAGLWISTQKVNVAECRRMANAWDDWVAGRVTRLLALKHKSSEIPERYLDHEDVMARSSKVTQFLAACASEGYTPPTQVPTPNFMKFVTANANSDYGVSLDRQFGHYIDDISYLKKVREQLELPCLLKSDLFLRKISSSKTYHEADAMIKAQNRGIAQGKCTEPEARWTTLVYRSNFLTTPDDAETFGRYFVFVPAKGTESDEPVNEPRYDRWIQFGIWLPEDRNSRWQPIQNVSVVSVARDDPHPNGGFDALADWWRVPRGDKSGFDLKFRRETPPYESENCTRCHKTIPIGIHPAAVYDFQGGKLKKVAGPKELDGLKPAKPPVGKQMHELGPVEVVAALAHYIQQSYVRSPRYEIDAQDTVAAVSNYGPPLGPDANDAAPDRSDQALQSCTAKHGVKESLAIQRVRESMSCAECHAGGPYDYGALNFPLATEKRLRRDEGAMPNLVRARILSGSMPLDRQTFQPVALSAAERRALYECLSREYFDPDKKTGLFVDWLKGVETPTVPSHSQLAASARARERAALKTKALVAPTDAGGVPVPPPFYKTECMKCHDSTGPLSGPSLKGVFMRPFAGLASYPRYSAAMKEAQAKGLVWDEANLMGYLKHTNGFMSEKLGKPAESSMRKRYPDEALRRELVDYLMVLK